MVIDALTRRQWVSEEDLARELKLLPKQLCRNLRCLEEEKQAQERRRDSDFFNSLDYSQVIFLFITKHDIECY